MTISAGAWLRLLTVVARRDLRTLTSYRSTFISGPLGMLFSLALFYFVSRLVTVPPFDSPDAYFAFVAVGLVIYGLIRSSLELPQTVRQELVGETFVRLELSAAGGTAATAGMLVTPVLYAMVLAVFTLLASALVFGVDLQYGTLLLGLPIGLLGSLAFAPFALVFSAITLAFKQAPGQGAVVPSLALVSGLYFPVELLPDWLRWLSNVQPLTATVDLMRHVIVGAPLSGSVAGETLQLVGFAVLGLPFGLWTVSFARRQSRRKGTLLES